MVESITYCSMIVYAAVRSLLRVVLDGPTPVCGITTAVHTRCYSTVVVPLTVTTTTALYSTAVVESAVWT